MAESKCGNDARGGAVLRLGHCDNEACICDPCECTEDNVCECCE